MQLHPIKGNDEDRNRQRQNRDRKPNRKRRQDIRSEEICRTSSKNSCLRKSSKTRQIRLDQGKLGLPKVVESDNMSIKPRKKIEDEGNKGIHTENKSRYTFLKEQKAKIILSRENAIQKIKTGLFLVQSQTGFGSYKVQWKHNRWVCNCPYFIKNKLECKHITALRLYLEIGYVTIEDESPEITTRSYPQNWKEYNHAQMHEFEYFENLLYSLVSNIEDSEQNMGRPRHKLSDLIYCCVMKAYSQLSSRRSQCVFEQALLNQNISKSIHYNAISRTLLKPELTPLLYDLVTQIATSLNGIETCFALDSSGFRCSTFSEYCRVKHGINRKHNWLKCHISTGVNSNIVAAVVITDEYGNDSPQFKKLVEETAKNFEIKELYGDPAYSSAKNLQIADKYNAKAFIPFKKNATGKNSGALWRKTFHFFQMHREEFEEHYHKRSNAESTFHAIKRKFGDSIKSKDRVAQENELLCKIIAYNITVLIHEMIQLNGTSELLSFDGLQKEVTMAPSDSF